MGLVYTGVITYKGWDGGWYIQGLRGCYIQGMGWGLVYTGVKGLLHTRDGMGAGIYRV